MKTISRLGWLSPKVEPRDTGHCGNGLFTITPVAKGELVSVQGGHIITFDELFSLVSSAEAQTKTLADYCYQITDELLLAATSWQEISAVEFINHSCNPNLGFQGELRLVALHDIAVGEEVTFDYSTCMTEAFWNFDCLCSTVNCRGRITGDDWKLPELQNRLRGYFQPYIEEKIRCLEK